MTEECFPSTRTQVPEDIPGEVPQPILIIDPSHDPYMDFAMDVALQHMESYNQTESISLGIEAAIEFKKQYEACEELSGQHD